MAEGILQKAGSGAGSDDVTVTRADMRSDRTGVTRDSNDEVVAGTMAVNGSMSAALNCGQSKAIPAGFTPGGTVTANSLAAQTGGVTADDAHVVSGYTYWRDGVKRTGNMTVSSVASFSVAAYSTSQVIATWKNPSRGPYSGVVICAKTGGYPANAWDGRVYIGVGSNAAPNGMSSATIGGLAAGTVYYFRIWVYCTCSAGEMWSGYLQTTCTPTAHGRAAYTSSGTFTVPAGVRSINVHCTGGGATGNDASGYWKDSCDSGGGGGGGYTSYKNNISVTPGSQIVCTVGNGGAPVPGDYYSHIAGNLSSAALNSIVLVAAAGGEYLKGTDVSGVTAGGKGGSNGGDGRRLGSTEKQISSDNGGSNGTPGQGTTTREFGLASGALYSGGGGGGSSTYHSSTRTASAGLGGEGGGGRGGYIWFVNSNPTIPAANGSAGTGGGGGGGGIINHNKSNIRFSNTEPTRGGSGNVIITW